jgi:hypothetical protein
VPLEGKRVNLTVTVSPAEFGNVYCNTTNTTPRDIVISNYSSNTLAWSATLLSATRSVQHRFRTTGNIAAGSSATPTTGTVKLAMKPLTAGFVGPISEDVEVEISGVAAPSGGKRLVKATASVRGIVFTINPTNSTGFFPLTTSETSRSRTRATSRTRSRTSSQRDPNTVQQGAWTNGFPSTVAAGTSQQTWVKFVPYQGWYGNYGATYSFVKPSSSPIPICNGVPTLHVTGHY